MILQGDCRDVLRTLEAESVQCVVTSPPYWGLRDYGCDGQLGLEATPEEYVANMVNVFKEVRRVLRPDGVLWLNLGDSYAGGGGFSPTAPSTATSKSGRHGSIGGLKQGGLPCVSGLKPKDLVGVPWRVAFALQADGWWLRSDVIWHKPNPMPESVTDRPTKAHEYVFLLTKSERYFYDADAIAEDASDNPISAARRNRADFGAVGTQGLRGEPFGQSGKGANAVHKGPTRNARTVWTIPTKPFPDAHFAVFPPELARRCIISGSRPGDTVLDPFNGAGTTGLVAQEHGRRYIGIELNPEYVAIAERRLSQQTLWMEAAS